MIDVWELAVREAVRDTLARYNHAGDRGRIHELAGQFTPDGVLELHSGPRMAGRAAIIEGLGGVVRGNTEAVAPGGPPPAIRHHVSSVLIHDVTPERAEAASYFAVLTRDGLDHWGRYRDVLVPFDGRWLLSHRFVRVDAFWPDSAARPRSQGLLGWMGDDSRQVPSLTPSKKLGDLDFCQVTRFFSNRLVRILVRIRV